MITLLFFSSICWPLASTRWDLIRICCFFLSCDNYNASILKWLYNVKNKNKCFFKESAVYFHLISRGVDYPWYHQNFLWANYGNAGNWTRSAGSGSKHTNHCAMLQHCVVICLWLTSNRRGTKNNFLMFPLQ